MGFGNCRRFEGIYFPLHRDPEIVKATESIVRPDIATTVPQLGDTGAARGQENQKNDATIERKLTLAAATESALDHPIIVSSGESSSTSKKKDGEQQDGKGFPPPPLPSAQGPDGDSEDDEGGEYSEAAVEHVRVKDLHKPPQQQQPHLNRAGGDNSNSSKRQGKKTAGEAKVTPHSEEKRRRLERQESLYWLQ
jgi:hypothetical protein